MKVVVFSGAGISQESGLQTFRDQGGLWEGHNVMEVCSASAWQTNPGRVLAFYNQRRRDALSAVPNAAHRAVAELEGPDTEVTVVTQNVDDLHERAGSTRVIHLHGEIMKKRSDAPGETELLDCREDIHLGDVAENGRQFRPHIVFFQEMLPEGAFEQAMEASAEADVLIVVGTTLEVTPAAYIASETGAERVFLVDPNPPSSTRVSGPGREVTTIAKPATEGIPEVAALLKR
jgi:NAD-dependent deacetylase